MVYSKGLPRHIHVFTVPTTTVMKVSDTSQSLSLVQVGVPAEGLKLSEPRFILFSVRSAKTKEHDCCRTKSNYVDVRP